MNRKTILVLLVILVSLSIPVFAAMEYTTTILYFNVGAANEIRVTLLSEGYTVAAAAGNATTQNIEFNSTGPDSAWVNAKVTGGGTQQDNTNPIITILNAGTTSPQVNMSVNSSQSGCINLHYFFNQSATAAYSAGTPASEVQLNATNVTLDSSYVAVSDASIGVWLWGNFSNCNQAASKAELFYIYANFP
jgi:hypothetical protein